MVGGAAVLRGGRNRVRKPRAGLREGSLGAGRKSLAGTSHLGTEPTDSTGGSGEGCENRGQKIFLETKGAPTTETPSSFLWLLSGDEYIYSQAKNFYTPP